MCSVLSFKGHCPHSAHELNRNLKKKNRLASQHVTKAYVMDLSLILKLFLVCQSRFGAAVFCWHPALLEQVFQAMEAGTVNKHDWSDGALQRWNKWLLVHTKHRNFSGG